MKKEEIGNNAGKIWQALFYKGSRATLDEVMDVTGLKSLEAAAAIGWLAREDKLIFSSDGKSCYVDIVREMYY